MDCAEDLRPACGSPTRGRREAMVEPDDVAAVLRLNELGWGARRIAHELGIARNTVRRYIRQGGWRPYQRPQRERMLDGLEGWLRQRLVQHAGNADVVRQELEAEKGIVVSLRTVERAVKPFRQELEAEAKATVRFETPPGKQLQIDFGCKLVEIGGEKVRVYLFVATLGYSRRTYVATFRHERQAAWLRGLEGAFRYFGGLPKQLLLDNARALVKHHNPETREVIFNDRFAAFCRYWDVTPRACAPYRARTKGKDERGVGYVKGNAIAGRTFAVGAQVTRPPSGTLIPTSRPSSQFTRPASAPVAAPPTGSRRRLASGRLKLDDAGQPTWYSTPRRPGWRRRPARSRRSA